MFTGLPLSTESFLADCGPRQSTFASLEIRTVLLARLKGELMQPENDLRDKRVIVIGGSSGIGLAVAQNAASRGAKIVIASSDERRLQKVVECIGGEATGERLDVSDEGSVETFFEKLGPIDHLVYTAGDSLQLRDLATTDLSEANRAFELRYWSVLAAVKYGSTPHSSWWFDRTHDRDSWPASRKGMGNCASVCGTVEALTRALAVELTPIRVNAVSPGVVRTNLWQNMTMAEREQLYESPDGMSPRRCEKNDT